LNTAIVEIGLGITLFTAIILVLVIVILTARSRLVATGSVPVLVNDERELQIAVGSKLLYGLADAQIFLASACGGGGTCGECRVQVLSGGGSILPSETSLISRREAADHYRLACQVSVKQAMQIRIPEEIFGVHKFECTVLSNRSVASFIKELVLQVPETEDWDVLHIAFVTRISILTKDFMLYGIATIYGGMNQTWSRRLHEPTRWQTSRSREK
jgi:Na+-transporting NADH:ubiquinone oxidoreductase subunit F